jgi:Eco57I restriction-modification methylase
MNPQQARERVAETFPQPFNKIKFLEFTRNLLNKFDESKSFARNSQYIKDAFKNHVSRFERLGTYTSPDDDKLDVLVVHLTSESKLERARTAIRNFVADHLKERQEREAALVAFVSPTERQWRFSYVKMEYAAVETETGRVDIETRITPARRFSYIVGEGESCHTAQSRFLALLQDTESFPTLAQLEEAFSVEAVTKEFFNQYAGLFGDIDAALQKLASKDPVIGKEFKAKNVSTVDFAKKLMGQIVFLYFLQKKGWLGVAKGQDWGTGPHDFLRRLVGQASSQSPGVNIFNDVLEPLFYDTLATDRGHEAWCSRFKCRIPFLNGGLFEPLGDYDWRKTDIILPNKLFTNTERNDVGDIGTGVLDVFDRYNFTVNEAEPLEKEVAIDPEMLGKVFENLIEENRRKGLGSFYTPREIVHYMCQESLINYLDTALNSQPEPIGPEKRKQALLGSERAEQTLLTGSAPRELVPRADLETFVHLGDQISHYEAVETRYAIKMPASIIEHARLIDEKLADITVCDPAVGSGAFPVGMMTEIVRARCALTPYFNDVHERTPYHFKRHAIQNCLYGVDIDPGAVEIAKLRLWLSLVVDEEETKQIKPLPNLDYKIVAGNSLLGFPFKSKRLEEIEKLKTRLFEEVDHDKKAKLKEQIQFTLNECLAASKKSLGYEVNFDFWIFFSEVFKAKSGFHVVLANPPYINSRSMAKADAEMRELIQATYTLTKGSWDIYIAFFEKGFRLLNPSGVLAFITPDKWISKPFGDALRTETTPKIFSILKAGREVFESVNVDAIVSIYAGGKQPRLRIYDYAGRQLHLKNTVHKGILKPPYAYDWLFSDAGELLLKLDANPQKLSDLAVCENSCATDDAYRLRKLIKEGSEDPRDGQYLRMINTGTIAKYVSKWGKREMVYLGSRYLHPLVNRKHFLEDFPKSYGLKSIRQKLILKGLNLLDACLDPDGSVIPGIPTLVICSDDLEVLKLLLVIVNSPVPFFYIKEKYPASSYNQGTTFTKEMLNDLPLPAIQAKDRAKLICLADQILARKLINQEADTTTLEAEVSQLLYVLYGLTPAEINAVMRTTKQRASKA